MKRYGFTVVIASLLSMTLLAAPKLAADQKASNEDCLMCHGEKSMTTKRGGRTVSLYLDQKRFTGSVHGSLSCTNCHADLDGKDLPHSTPLAKVNCGACHSDESQLQSQYQSPYANVTWTFHPGWAFKGGWNYYGYGEEGPAGPTLPRNFHANIVTLAMRYQF